MSMVSAPAVPVVNISGQAPQRRSYRRPANNKFKKKYYNLLKKRREARKKMQDIIGPRGEPASIGLWGKDFASASDYQKALRSATGFRGEGDYRSFLKYGSRGIGALAGGALGYMGGGFMGGAAGAQSGWGQGASFSKFMGWGDYNPRVSNQIAGGDNNPDNVISVNASDDMTGDIYFSHSEFIGNITATTAASGVSPFEVVSYALNPGMTQTFPFLSQIAQNFTLYDFHGLMFQFRSTSSDSTTSTATGKIIMATQYDVNAAEFFNSVQMENYDYASSCKPGQGMVHGVETAQHQQFGNMYYIRTGATSRDLTFTDLGTFQVATEGITGAASTTLTLGELWVTYRVKLSRANLYGSLLGANISQDVIEGTCSNAALVIGATAKSTNQIGCTLTNVSATQCELAFPENISLGSYQITLAWIATGNFGATQTITASTNFANLVCWIPGTTLPAAASAQIGAPSTGVAANASLMVTTWVTVQAPGNSIARIRFNTSAALAAGTVAAYITQVNQVPSLALA